MGFILNIFYTASETFMPLKISPVHTSQSSYSRVTNHMTSDDRVHGISENKLLDSGSIFLDIFVNTCPN